MALEIGILFAIITMLSWGTADVFAKKAINKIGYKTALLLNQATAIVPLIVLAILFFKPPPLTPELILIIFSAGIIRNHQLTFFSTEAFRKAMCPWFPRFQQAGQL